MSQWMNQRDEINVLLTRVSFNIERLVSLICVSNDQSIYATHIRYMHVGYWIVSYSLHLNQYVVFSLNLLIFIVTSRAPRETFRKHLKNVCGGDNLSLGIDDGKCEFGIDAQYSGSVEPVSISVLYVSVDFRSWLWSEIKNYYWKIIKWISVDRHFQSFQSGAC